MARVAGECNPLLADFLRRLRNVERMVGNSLKIGDRMQKLQTRPRSAARQLASGELYKIRAQNILVAVDDALHALDLGKILVRIVTQQRQRAREVQLGVRRHRVDGNAALLDGKRPGAARKRSSRCIAAGSFAGFWSPLSLTRA